MKVRRATRLPKLTDPRVWFCDPRETGSCWNWGDAGLERLPDPEDDAIGGMLDNLARGRAGHVVRFHTEEELEAFVHFVARHTEAGVN